MIRVLCDCLLKCNVNAKVVAESHYYWRSQTVLPTAPSCILKSSINLSLDSHITTIHNSLLPPLKTESSSCYKDGGVISNHYSSKRKRGHNKTMKLNYVKSEKENKLSSNRNEWNLDNVRGSVVVKALCCKPEDRGFKSQWGGFFKLT
jgi:hypothetical protein